MQNNFKLSRVAASVALVIAGLAGSQSALAGSGFADVVKQDGTPGRIGTYFAYSPSGVRTTPVPEAENLPNPNVNKQNTGKALRKFIDPLPTHLGLSYMADGVTQKKVTVGVSTKWVNPKGVTTNDDYYEIAVVEFTNRFHTDLRKETVQRGYVQLDQVAANDPTNTAKLPGSDALYLYYPNSSGKVAFASKAEAPADAEPVLIGGTDSNGKLTGFKVHARLLDQPRFMGPILIAKSTNPVSGVNNGDGTKGSPIRVKFHNLLPTGRAELGPDVNGKAVVTNRRGDIFLPTDKYILGAGFGPDGVTEYTQNRADIHLHGGDTPWISDGTPHQWITPIDEADPSNPRSLAAEFANPDNVRDASLLPHFLRGDSAVNVPDMYDPGPGAMTYYFPNGQTARFQWYHDHSFGATRLNVYAGMFAAYPIVDQTVNDMAAAGVLPAVGGPRYLPLLLQDRTFVPDDIALQDARWNTTAWGAPGDLWFPHVYETVQDPAQENNWNAVGRWHYGPWFWPVFPSLYALPTSEYSKHGEPNNVSTTPEAWMDTPIVNGTAYPTIEVEPEVYRMALLNGTNDRVLTFNLFEAKTSATLADGTVVTNEVIDPNTAATATPQVIASEIDMVPAALPATADMCAAGQTRPTLLRLAGSIAAATSTTPAVPAKDVFCWPETWPTDNRLGGVPDPAGVGPSVYQFASEGGWLPKVVKIDPVPLAYLQDTGRINVLNPDTAGLFLAPAERAEIMVDFSQYAGKTLLVYNDSGAPVPAGDPRNDLFTGVGDQTGSGGTEDTKAGYGPNIRTFMQIKVKAQRTDGKAIVAFNPAPLEAAVTSAYFATQERPSVAQPAYAAFDPSWASLTPAQSYASIYTGSLKEPVFKYVPGIPEAGFNRVQVSAAGSGYITAPAVTIAPPLPAKNGDQAATAKSTLKIDTITVQTEGTGYTAAPLVRIVGGGGNGATATSTLSINNVTINPLYRGSYTTVPTTVNFSAPPAGGTKPLGATIQSEEILPATTPKRYRITGVTIPTVVTATTGPGTGYTAAPLVSFSGGVGTAARATASGGVGAVKVTNPDPSDPSTAGGGGYVDLSQTLVNFTGGGGTGALAFARGKVFDITLTHPGVGYGPAELPSVSLTASPTGNTNTATAVATGQAVSGGFAQASSLVKTKTIQELFDPTYGRLNATFGVELPFTSALTQTTIPLNYVDPITEQFADGETQIWKITHNGVDTHPIHFHLMNVQIINRVAWDGWIMPALPQELGWKETIKMNPLEDVIVAVRAKKPALPFGLPLSNRLMDPTQPVGSPFGFTQIDPTTGFPATVVNQMANYGWEYVWHCHILGHEENDFMRAVRFDANEAVPTAPTGLAASSTADGLALSWTDISATEYKFEVQRANVVSTGNYGAFTPVGTTLANLGNFVDTSAKSVTSVGASKVAYKVVAVGGYGANESAPFEVTLTQAVGAPAAPTSMTAVAQSDTAVRVSWQDPATDELGFLVERTLDAGATWTALTVPTQVGTIGSVPLMRNLAANTLSVVDTGRSPGQTVQYRIKAVNAVDYSAEVTANVTMTVPTMTTVSAAVNSPSQVTLTWPAITVTAPQVLSGYRIVRTGGTGPAMTFDGIAAGTTSWVDTGLEQHTAYSYAVQPVDSSGTVPVYGAASVASATTYYAPVSTISTLTAVSSSPTNVTLSWTGGVPAVKYLVYRCEYSIANANCTNASTTWNAWVVPAPASGYADNTAIGNTTYRYYVLAINGTVANTTTVNKSNTKHILGVTTPTN